MCPSSHDDRILVLIYGFLTGIKRRTPGAGVSPPLPGRGQEDDDGEIYKILSLISDTACHLPRGTPGRLSSERMTTRRNRPSTPRSYAHGSPHAEFPGTWDGCNCNSGNGNSTTRMMPSNTTSGMRKRESRRRRAATRGKRPPSTTSGRNVP